MGLVQENIKFLIWYEDLSQQKLANRLVKKGLSVNRGNVESWLNKGVTPKPEILSEVANIFRIALPTIINIELNKSNIDDYIFGNIEAGEPQLVYKSENLIDIIEKLELKHSESHDLFSKLRKMVARLTEDKSKLQDEKSELQNKIIDLLERRDKRVDSM